MAKILFLILAITLTGCSITTEEYFYSAGVIQADNLTIDGKAEGYHPDTAVLISCILVKKRFLNSTIIHIMSIERLYETEDPEDYRAGTVLIRGTVDGKQGLWPETRGVIKYEN
jgi:hypothetical protein